MRLRKPHTASLDEVSISRRKHEAVVRFREPGYVETHLEIGSDVCRMTDQDILEYFNQCLRDEAQALANQPLIATEIPEGQAQIEYFENAQQWAPRAAVLRCVVDDSGPAGEAVFYIDDVELSLADFGKLLATYSGWGMRICFLPEERLGEQPSIIVEPPD